MTIMAMAVPSAKIRRRGKKAKRLKNNPVNEARPDILVPTVEYLAQPDGPVKLQTGGYRVVDALERLYSRRLLDAVGDMNEAMYLAARWLAETWRRGGLDISLGGGELDRIVSSGGNFSDKLDSHAGAVDARKEFVHACHVMGWYNEFPFRGSGRIVVGYVCYGYCVEECAKLYLNITGERGHAVAMDRLREGLASLAGLRRLIGRRTASGGSVVAYRGFDATTLASGP